MAEVKKECGECLCGTCKNTCKYCEKCTKFITVYKCEKYVSQKKTN